MKYKYDFMVTKDKLDEKEIEELNDCIAKYRPSHRMYIKLIAVKYVKTGKTRTKVSEILHVNRRTVGNWVKSYEEEGIAGLIPKYENCGLKCKLSNEQLLKLQEILTNPEESYSLKDAKKIIKKELGVDYSIKQVWVITRKKLGLNYRKPFIKYNEAPENADEILKKKL